MFLERFWKLFVDQNSKNFDKTKEINDKTHLLNLIFQNDKDFKKKFEKVFLLIYCVKSNFIFLFLSPNDVMFSKVM